MEYLKEFLSNSWRQSFWMIAICIVASLVYFVIKARWANVQDKKMQNNKKQNKFKRILTKRILIIIGLCLLLLIDPVVDTIQVKKDMQQMQTKTIVGVVCDSYGKWRVWGEITFQSGKREIFLIEGKKYEIEYFVNSKVICSAKRVFY